MWRCSQEKEYFSKRWRQSSGTFCTWTLTSNVLKSTLFPIKHHYVSSNQQVYTVKTSQINHDVLKRTFGTFIYENEKRQVVTWHFMFLSVQEQLFEVIISLNLRQVMIHGKKACHKPLKTSTSKFRYKRTWCWPLKFYVDVLEHDIFHADYRHKFRINLLCKIEQSCFKTLNFETTVYFSKLWRPLTWNFLRSIRKVVISNNVSKNL